MHHEQFTNWYQELPILAYGELSDEDVISAFTQILTWKRNGVFISDTEDKTYPIPESEHNFTTTEYWLYLGLLTDCIEYGSSPRGAWLTDFGDEVLDFLLSSTYSDCCYYPMYTEGQHIFCSSCHQPAVVADTTKLTPREVYEQLLEFRLVGSGCSSYHQNVFAVQNTWKYYNDQAALHAVPTFLDVKTILYNVPEPYVSPVVQRAATAKLNQLLEASK